MMFLPFKNTGRAGILTLALTAALSLGLLAGCSEIKRTNENIAERQSEADAALQMAMPKGKVAQALEIDSRPYYGSHAVPITNGNALPPQFEQPGAVVMTFARPVTMSEFTRMIQSVTGMRANTSAAHGGTQANAGEGSDQTFLPSGGEQVSGGRVVWQGRLSDLLNEASDVFRADWRYDGTSITFAQEVTRTFMLHALAGELALNGSVSSGGGSGSTSNLPQVNVTSTSGLKIWEDIKAAVDTIMGDAGSAAYSQSTGTITITSSPEVVRRVESYLNQQNSMRLRRVAVAVKVLSITANNELTLETDLTGIIKRAFNQASLRTVGTSATGLAIGILKKPLDGVDSGAQPEDDSDGDQIEADRLVTELRLNRNIERVAIVHSGALMTLSDQPAPLQVGRQISYLARTSSTSGDTSSVSLEPGSVDTGLMMTVLPRIVEQNRILMRISVAISDLTQLAEFGPADNQIQLPEVETTGFLQNAVLTSGETLILAGFEKDQNESDTTGAPGALSLLSGAKNTSRSRVITVLMLTSEILPEEPMTVVGQ